MACFDFDIQIDWLGVPALKRHRRVLGDAPGALFAAGVADMDFRVAPPILTALQQRLDHGVFGYEAVPDGLIPALHGWLRARHNWDVDVGWILRAPNALNSLAIAAALFTEPGGGVIVQPPVFFDFFDIIREADRELVFNPLILEDGRYRMDLEGLEALVKEPSNRLLFLCNPHNPVGRAWTRSELHHLHEICSQNNVLVVADELHGDIVFPGQTYVPYASISPAAAAESVTVVSPAKSFNIASCCSAFSIVPDEARRAVFQRENSRLTVNKNSAFANAAMEAAYRSGAPWLDAVIDYLHGNLQLIRERTRPLPGVELVEPDATFLAWLDFRGLGKPPDELKTLLRRDAGWVVTRGSAFGVEGDGFMRMNFACRRKTLSKALDALCLALSRT